MKKQKLFLFYFIIILSFIFLFCLYSPSYAADPKLISTLKKAFEKIKNWIIAISTPAAAVSIGAGVLMKKFSFGDEEKIRVRKKSNSWYYILLCFYSCCRFNSICYRHSRWIEIFRTIFTLEKDVHSFGKSRN